MWLQKNVKPWNRQLWRLNNTITHRRHSWRATLDYVNDTWAWTSGAGDRASDPLLKDSPAHCATFAPTKTHTMLWLWWQCCVFLVCSGGCASGTLRNGLLRLSPLSLMASAVPPPLKEVSLLLGRTLTHLQTTSVSLSPTFMTSALGGATSTNCPCFFKNLSLLATCAVCILSYFLFDFHWPSLFSFSRTRDGSVHFWECPRSVAGLQHICRMSLRRVMTTQQVEGLAIPTPLRDYLTYKVI